MLKLRLCGILLALAALSAGCFPSRTQLPVAPNVLRDGSGTSQLEALPPEQKTPQMRIFYITDRKIEKKEDRQVYTHQRAGNVTYGVATVEFPKDVTWAQVAAYSSSGHESQYTLRVGQVQPLGQFVPTIERLKVVDGKLIYADPQARDLEEAQARDILRQELAKTPYKDVYLFVHGFNNTFDDAILRLACLWHYLGRRGLPVAYTWPAGHGGLLGYFYDRESGEFTVFNLKRAIKIIASCPSVERIHIIAHSRGTDVVSTALRELNIEYTSAGLDPQKQMKLDTLVLAAPDLDRDVFRQRFTSENLLGVTRQMVLYASASDGALGLSNWLFGSTIRLGNVGVTDVSPSDMAMLRQLPSAQLVVTDVRGFSTSHDYVFTNPAALSDLILVLRDRKGAGEQNGRPLKDLHGIWYLDNNYFRRK